MAVCPDPLSRHAIVHTASTSHAQAQPAPSASNHTSPSIQHPSSAIASMFYLPHRRVRVARCIQRHADCTARNRSRLWHTRTLTRRKRARVSDCPSVELALCVPASGHTCSALHHPQLVLRWSRGWLSCDSTTEGFRVPGGGWVGGGGGGRVAPQLWHQSETHSCLPVLRHEVMRRTSSSAPRSQASA